MLAVPLLADFAVRLAFGLILALIGTSWRAVPLRFFRIHTQVILGVLVLAALAQARASGPGPPIWLVVAAAVLAYLATVSWGLGLPRIGVVCGVLAALATAAWLTEASRFTPAGSWALNALSRGASGFLMGATLTAMLLGHYYLIAPAMTIEPLKRSVCWIALGLAARCLLASLGVLIAYAEPWRPDAGRLTADPTLLVARWGLGFVGTAVSVYLAYRTVQIRSTQSATGILYITMIFVLFGELTSLVDVSRGVMG
jgi:hypothetical protein